jgi:hypothetical protein
LPPPPAEPGAEPTASDDLLQKSREEQLAWVYEILFGAGSLEKEDAIQRVATALADLGLAGETAGAKGDPTRKAIERALTAGVKEGRFDQPERGRVRAIRPDPKDWSVEDWGLALASALDREPTAREAALRFAAYWAQTNLGLVFSRLREGGTILNGLSAALDLAIRRGSFLDDGTGCVRKA